MPPQRVGLGGFQCRSVAAWPRPAVTQADPEGSLRPMTRIDRSRGLGRPLSALLAQTDPEGSPGLTALIPASPQDATGQRAGATTVSGYRQDERAFLGLEVLQRAFRLDLAALAHHAEGKEHQIQLMLAPGLLDKPLDAFPISDLVDEMFRTKRIGSHILVQGISCLCIPTPDHDEPGLYVLGRRGSPLSTQERRISHLICQALGSSVLNN